MEDVYSHTIFIFNCQSIICTLLLFPPTTIIGTLPGSSKRPHKPSSSISTFGFWTINSNCEVYTVVMVQHCCDGDHSSFLFTPWFTYTPPPLRVGFFSSSRPFYVLEATRQNPLLQIVQKSKTESKEYASISKIPHSSIQVVYYGLDVE